MKTTSKPFQDLLGYVKRSRTLTTRTKQSLEWYRKKIQMLFGTKPIDAKQIFERNRYQPMPIPGHLIIFKYNPKYAKTLPYYDTFPLVLVLHKAKRGFIGLNMHYLRLTHRAYFMALLYDFQKYDMKNKQVIINIKYQILKSTRRLSYYKPCIKRYLNSRIGSLFYNVPPDEWDIALFLPFEHFVKETKENVWKESKRKI